MAQPIVLQDAFTRMIQDLPRDELPRDACWLIQDYIPNLGLNEFSAPNAGGRLTKRGGWQYASEDVSLDSTSATSITAMGYLPASNKLCLTTNNNKFGYITLPGEGPDNDYTQVSTSSIQSAQQYFVFDNKLIITNNDGTTAVKSYDGTTFGDLANSPPTCKYGCPWGDRMILGNTAANPHRVYFSAELGAAWDTVYGWKDVLQNITGFASLPNAVLVFGADQTARIRGKTPPPGSPDMVTDDPIFNIGCTFPNSIAVNGANCVFANEEGVFLTDGTSVPRDLTKLCGVKSTWHQRAAQAFLPHDAPVGTDPGLENAYGGFIGNYYLIATRPTEYSNIAFLFDLSNQSCTVHSNFAANSVAMTPQIGDELYMGMGTRVVATSYIFSPTENTSMDADETEIEPELETRFFLDTSSHRKRWKTGYLDYRMDSTPGAIGTLSPTLTVSYTTEPQGTSYTTIGELSQTEDLLLNPIHKRAKLPIRKAERGLAFKISQTHGSYHTVITSLSADVHAREAGRV